jgi:reticulon-4-interacting protein 1, mitochondrial
MRAVEIVGYGTAADVLRVTADASLPVAGPNEVLVQVHAASVNPVDCAIRRGYGKEVFRPKGQVGEGPFPQRLGRDAAGIVTDVGSAVKSFKRGDRIFAAPNRPAMAEVIAVPEDEAALAPEMLTDFEAASLPFVAMTVWNALVGQVGIKPGSARGTRILITRGAGGVGSFAIQLLKAWGAYVAATTSTANVEFVRDLGADRVIDHMRESLGDLPADFDIVFDSSFDRESELLALLKKHAGGSYVTITSPMMRIIDEFGLQEGSRRADELLAERRRAQAELGRSYHWGHMRPSGSALSEIASLVRRRAIRPVVDRVFKVSDIVAAHEYSESGQARGKIVIDLQ